MSCELCGGGDIWIKTCRTPEGSRLLVCDGCYGENASVLVIARRRGSDGQVRPLLALRQPQGVRGGKSRRAQEHLLGDVPGVRGGGASRPARRGRLLGPSAELPLCLIVEVELVGLYLL
jgi:hypothetical protein